MKKITITNHLGLNIVGVLEQPIEELEIQGVCVVQHGYGGFKEQPHIQAMKDAFLENGFITFNFDATNSFGESDGKYEDALLGLHYEDMNTVCEWVQEQEWFKGRFAVTGHSMGGYAAARYAQDNCDKVDLVVPVAPVVSGKLRFEAYEQFYPGQLEKWKRDGVLNKESKSKPSLVRIQPWQVMEEYKDHDLLPRANELHMPTLLVVGSEDTSCRPQDVKMLFDSIGPSKHGQSKYVAIEGAPHTYREEEHLAQLKMIISDWIKNI